MGARIVVTGGDGRLGRAITATGDNRITPLNRATLDITDRQAVEATLRNLSPAAVINCAALTAVDPAEAQPGRYHAVNAEGAETLAMACAEVGVPLIHISTDYVFGAETPAAPWREDDTLCPINAYGASKADGERRVAKAGGQVCIARVAWLFGDKEDFISKIMNAAEGAALRIADDQIGSPTPLDACAERLVRLASWMIDGSVAIPPILHLSGAPPVSRADWVETALAALASTGRPIPALVRCKLDDFTFPAVRPHHSGLDTAKTDALFGGSMDWRAATVRKAETLAQGL